MNQRSLVVLALAFGSSEAFSPSTPSFVRRTTAASERQVELSAGRNDDFFEPVRNALLGVAFAAALVTQPFIVPEGNVRPH